MTTSISQRLAWCFLVLALAPATALAGKKEEAKAHKAKAAKAYKEARYDEARAELETAYALDPNPELLYAIGQVEAKLGNCRDAIAHFKRYAASQHDPQIARVVDQAIAACKPAPAPAAEPPATDASASRPAEPPPSADRPPLDAPPPAEAKPAPPAVVSQPASPAKPSPRPFAPTRAAPAPVAPEQRSAWYQDKLGDGLVLGGVAAAVVGLVEYRSALSDLDAAENRTTTTTLARYNDLVDRAHGKRTASIVLTGAGGALIAAGIARYILHDRSTEVRGVGIAPAHGGGVVTYLGRF